MNLFFGAVLSEVMELRLNSVSDEERDLFLGVDLIQKNVDGRLFLGRDVGGHISFEELSQLTRNLETLIDKLMGISDGLSFEVVVC